MPSSNTVAIGGPGNDDNGSDAGHVRVYEWNGVSWVQKGSDIDGENAVDYFGYCMNMPDDNTIAIGAPLNDDNGTDAGHVRIFEWNGNSWNQKGMDLDGNSAGNHFGCSVSMPNPNTIAIGARYNDDNGSYAGHVRSFKWNGADWIQKGNNIEGNANELLGYSVAMPDTQTVAAGAIEYNNSMGYTCIYTFCELNTTVSVSDFELTSNAIDVQYQWLDCDNGYAPISGQTSHSYTATSNGNYAVEVSQNGCADTSDCVAITTVGLDDLKNTYGVHVYPNPASDIINIQSNQKIETVRLLNISGQLIKQTEAKNMAVGELNPGVYLVQVITSNGVVTKRIVKQ